MLAFLFYSRTLCDRNTSVRDRPVRSFDPDTIHNYSMEAYRRVECKARLAHTVDVGDAIRRLKLALAAIPNVQKEPAPDVEIVDFTPRGPVLAVRPYTHTDHYWQVYFDTNRVIVNTFGAAGYPVPEDRIRMLTTVPVEAGTSPASGRGRGSFPSRSRCHEQAIARGTHPIGIVLLYSGTRSCRLHSWQGE